MYTIHIIKALHIVHIFEFCFERTITSIFGTSTKTQFIQIIQLFKSFLNINFLIFWWFTFCSIIFFTCWTKSFIFFFLLYLLEAVVSRPRSLKGLITSYLVTNLFGNLNCSMVWLGKWVRLVSFDISIGKYI